MCVGKSSLVIQFVEDRFVDSYYPTIENTFAKSITHKNLEYDCEIIDTAGQVCSICVFYASIQMLLAFRMNTP